MKLARPDIRHPRIVLAGSGEGDDAGLVAALRNRGLHAHWLAWDHPGALTADLVILRDSSTDPEFVAWARRVPHLLNAPEVVAWNTGRRHLRDLRDAGLPVLGRRPSGSAVRTALVFLGGIQSHAFVENPRQSRPISNCGTSASPVCKWPPITSISGSTSCSTPAPTWSANRAAPSWRS